MIPIYARVVRDARDFSIVDLPVDGSDSQRRIGVIYDKDRDQRVLDVLNAIWLLFPTVCITILALYEAEGTLAVWTTGKDIAAVKTAVQTAADAALKPRDSWMVTVISAMTCGDVLDRGTLAKDDPLLVIPEKYKLGVVRSS